MTANERLKRVEDLRLQLVFYELELREAEKKFAALLDSLKREVLDESLLSHPPSAAEANGE